MGQSTGRAERIAVGDWKPKFLEMYRETGNVSRSARFAGISREHIYHYRKDNEAFRAEMAEAEAEALEALEFEAYRRAAVGVDKPVYYKGEQCGVIREYSDTLLIFLLKARAPHKYRENLDITSGGESLVVKRVGGGASMEDLK